MKPNVGMSYAYAAIISAYTPGTGITYGTPFQVSEARGATLNWEGSDGEFYGDNTLLDTDTSTTRYTLDFETAGLKSDVRAKLLGETVLSNSAGYRVTDEGSPETGFAFIKTMREDVEGVVTEKYEGWFFFRLKFRLNSEETRTKERNIEWNVPTLNGTGMGAQLDSSGKIVFCEHQDFSSLADAKTWVTGKFTT